MQKIKIKPSLAKVRTMYNVDKQMFVAEFCTQPLI